MRAIDILQLIEPEIVLSDTKVHLASHNGIANPLDEYLSGRFQEWQRWQSRRNFERRLVMSLIALPETSRWLFAGVYASMDCERRDRSYYYDLRELSACAELSGRLVVDFQRLGRQSYLNGDNLADQLVMSHILERKVAIANFPGFKAVDLSRSDLRTIVEQNLESWRSALSSVAGVYLISDTNSGKLYVGSATGEGGIWQRWSQYAFGHGDNVELRVLWQAGGAERANAFRFSVLEIADTHASPEEIVRREAHWKKVLLSRQHGLNAN